MTKHPTLRLYRHALSGHSHRVELLLSLLELPCELVDVEFARLKEPEFLARNAFGQVPVLEDDGLTLADSNAILVYLATRYDAERRYFPLDPLTQAEVQRWLSVAAGQLAMGPAAARAVTVFGAKLDQPRAQDVAQRLFGVLDGVLGKRSFLVDDRATIADLALYTYTAHAPEGGVSLEPFANVRSWLARIEALRGFVAMQGSPARGA